MKRILIIFTTLLILCGLAVTAISCNGGYNSVPMTYDIATKYGVYWFGEDNNDYMRSGENMDVKYFDPSKPTFVFAHGWEPEDINSKNGFFEDFVTHNETISNTETTDVRDYAKELKGQGYNVACLSWFSYAKTLNNLFRYIWISFDGGYALSTRCAMELALVLGEDYQGDVKMVGHSYGSQLALATTYQLIAFQKCGMITNDHIIPTRLTLADPYIGDSVLIAKWDSIKSRNLSFTNEKLRARKPAALFADVTASVVKSKDVAIDMYFGMSVASTAYFKYDGKDENFEKLSKNSAIVKSRGLEAKYGDFKIHNIVRDWVLLTIVDNVTKTDQNGDAAPTGAASDDQIKALRGKCYNQTYEGFDVKNDSLILFDRNDETY